MADNYDFAILGAGALGSILGAHLSRAGARVAMLARGSRADLVRREGLRITGLVHLASPVEVLRDPAQLSSADALIVATKTPGTADALSRLSHVRVGTAFSVQNGTLKNELLARAFGADHVLGCLADTSGELLRDGSVLFTRNVNLLLGELRPGTDRARRLAAAIDSSGVRCAAVSNIVSLEWSKFVPWVGLLILAVTVRSPTWQYLSDPDSALILVRLAREMGALASAQGVELIDGSALPAATMCRGSEADAVAAVLRYGESFRAQAPGHRMSSLQDVEAGRPLEIHETLGHALRQGKELGVPMPLLDAFYRVIIATERTRTRPAPSAG